MIESCTRIIEYHVAVVDFIGLGGSGCGGYGDFGDGVRGDGGMVVVTGRFGVLEMVVIDAGSVGGVEAVVVMAMASSNGDM